MFRLYEDAFSIFYLEANLMKKRGNKFVINMRGCNYLKNMVNNHISTEISKYKVGKFKPVNLLNFGICIINSNKNLGIIKRSDWIYLQCYDIYNEE